MMRVLAAFVRRSWIESTNEVITVVLAIVSFVLAMASQLFLGRLVDSAHNPALGPYSGSYGAYLIIGMAVLDLQHAFVSGLSTRIREAQRQGTVESMLATPASPGLILAGLAASDVVWALFRMGLYSILGVMFFGIRVEAAQLVSALVTFLFAASAFAALGVLGGALTMFMRRGNPIALVIGSSSMIAGGIFYPRSVLPEFLHWIGDVLPITPAVNALRQILVRGDTLGAIAPHLVRLAGFTIVGGIVGGYMFFRALEEARKEGSLTSL